MENNESVIVRVARIIAISGVVAGATAGAAGRLLTPKLPSESQPARIRIRSVKGAQQALDRLSDVDPASSATALRGALSSVSDASGLDIERWKMNKPNRKDASALADRMRATVNENKGKAGEAATDIIHEAADFISEMAKESRGATDLAKKSYGRHRHELTDHAAQLRKQSGEHFTAMERYVAEAMEDKVIPSLTKAGKGAAHAADDLRSRLSDQLDHLGDLAEDRRPQVAMAADQASRRISHLLQDADSAADGWRDTAERAWHEAEEMIHHNARSARDFAGEAGDSAKQGSKDVASLAFWLVVAGGLIYAFLLDEEQKRKSRETAETAFREGRDVYRDLRGRDADFNAQ